MKSLLCLGVLAASALWADEAADRTAIEATISALNTSPTPSNIFTADFPNAAELQRFRQEARPATPPTFPTSGVTIRTPDGTLVISREPMGEAVWIPAVATITSAMAPRFVTRSVTFIAPDTAVVVAVYERPFRSQASQSVPVLFVVKNVSTNEGPDWRIASFRALPEAGTKAL